ncbi:hypothetical protein L6R46_12040 [Myxococcota bacterium]|nr:hypothetical protein [Myxococcota bacterium]
MIVWLVELAIVLWRRGTPLPLRLWWRLIRPHAQINERLQTTLPVGGGARWGWLSPRSVLAELEGIERDIAHPSGFFDGALGPTSAWPDRLTHAEIVPLAFAGDAFLALRFEPGKPPSGVWFGPQNPEQDPNRYTWAAVDLEALLSAHPARIAAKEPR